MKIKKKLLLVFIGLASFVGLAGYFSIAALSQINTDVKQIRQSSILELESTADMIIELMSLKALFKEYIYEAGENSTSGTNETEKIEKEMERGFSSYIKASRIRHSITASGLHLYKDEELRHEKAELQKHEELEKEFTEYKDNIRKITAYFKRTNHLPDNKIHKVEWNQHGNTLITDVQLFYKHTQEEITAQTTSVEKHARRSTLFLAMISGLAFVLAIVSGIYISKSIVSPIVELKNAANNIAMGNMDVTHNVESKDELGDLARSFNKMTVDLKKSRSLVEENNRTLEKKVNERTRDLKEIIQRLKESDERLQKYSNDLKNSNSELEQFAYVASHDLQEPLRTTSSFAELLQKQYKGQLDSKADKYLSFITQSSDRMKVLINDLLEFSKIGRKKELGKVDCSIVVKEVLDDLNVAITEAEAVINLQELPVITGFATEIKQLFQNLIINAVKFRRQNVPLAINIAAQQNDSHWQFAVSDNGIGIEAQHKERIFVIFQRLHTRKEYEGSGIGLSHCKKIVELHNGKIWLDSEREIGSIFYFTIPCSSTDINEVSLENDK